MKVFLAQTSHAEEPDRTSDFAVRAQRWPTTRHDLVTDPALADMVLFTDAHLSSKDWSYRALRRHPLVDRFRSTCAVYDERDRPWAVLPGAYVSMPQRNFDARSQVSVAYYALPELTDPTPRRELLFSFQASPTHRCREPLFGLRHPDAAVERVTGFTFYDVNSEDFAHRKARFAEVTAKSTFVLCPRGRGTSSIRMYEAMAAGSVPVVIADDWVPPAGINWSELVIRWPEGRIDGLIAALESRADDASVMAAAGAAAYREWFAPEVAIGRIIDAAGRALVTGGRTPLWRQPAFWFCGAGDLKQRGRRALVDVRNTIRRP